MDARRLGHGVALAHALLEAAAPAYLTDTEWDVLGENGSSKPSPTPQPLAKASRPVDPHPPPPRQRPARRRTGTGIRRAGVPAG
jgi:hypothetical protein